MAPLSSGTVALVSLDPSEVQQISEMVGHFDAEASALPFSSLLDAEPLLSSGNTALVILRIDESRRRPDQDIRRIKRSLARPVPLLVLMPPEFARKVKEFLKAGADEYWILPMDDSAFPPRLHVLFDWGQTVLNGERGTETEEREARSRAVSLLSRLRAGLQQLFSLSRSEPPVHASGLSTRIANRWEKVRRLGFGSFGEVWLVEDRQKAEPVVAKIPHSPKLNTKFIREAAILKRLVGHPNAVQLKDVVKEDGKVIILQEYVEGSTLQELLDQDMESAVKEKAFLDLLQVVAYAHEQHIMHRDIKPENIIVTGLGVLKLLDFGTGKDLTRRSMSSTIIGSRPYMAPEQIMGKSRIASDVWALGVILYALSTCCLPFYDDNEKQLMDLILEIEPEAPRSMEPGLPEDLEVIILKCLKKDLDERYRSAVELREDLLAHFPDFGSGQVMPG